MILQLSFIIYQSTPIINHYIIQTSIPMINPSFNQDVNFTRGQFDIKELNAFMNEKRRKAEKEATKYDVDRDTQAKSQKVQHLSSMAQYLPLFTKKIKDPKAMKKQKATKELDYTKNKEQLEALQRQQEQQLMKTQQELIAAQAQLKQLQQQQNFTQTVASPRRDDEDKVIRDPSPRIVSLQEQQALLENQTNTLKKLEAQNRRGMPQIQESISDDHMGAEDYSPQANVRFQPQKEGSQQLLLDQDRSLENFMDKMQTQLLDGGENSPGTPIYTNPPPAAPQQHSHHQPKQQSPGRLTQTEMLQQAAIVDKENYYLRCQVEEKRKDLEAINFKHAKAQSKFIEIMRELSRFRDEFNDQYSIRSRMQKVKDVTDSIENLLDIKEYILANEEQQLQKFIGLESQLFDAKSPMPAKRQLQSTVARDTNPQNLHVRTIVKIGQQLGRFCTLGQDYGTRLVKISNVLCFARCEIKKALAECRVTLQTKLSNETLHYTFTHITERFDPWKEIQRLKFVAQENGTIEIDCVENLQDKRITEVLSPQTTHEATTSGSPVPLYTGVENTVVKYIHGSPVRLFTLGFSLVPATGGKRNFQITVLDQLFNKLICTVEVAEERLFREVVPSTLNNRNYETELKSLVFKRDAVQNLITKYIKKYLQVVIVGVDITEQSMLNPGSGTMTNHNQPAGQPGTPKGHGTFDSQLRLSDKFGSVGIVDREVRSLKFRHTEFPGLRVPSAALSLNNNNMSMTISPQKTVGGGSMNFTKAKAGKSSSGSNTHRNMLANSNEKMKAAVQEHLSKKKDFSTIANPSMFSVQSTPSNQNNNNNNQRQTPGQTPSQQPIFEKRAPSNKRGSGKYRSLSSQEARPENSKMQQIMKLIHANSMFMHIHSELYFHDKDDFPAYLEMVHNTDDDSLILFIVDDPRDCFVREIGLNEITDNENWLLIQQRYGKNAEQILVNVETIFRSREFLKIIRLLIANSRKDRQYSSTNQVGADEMPKSPSGVFNFRIQVNY